MPKSGEKPNAHLYPEGGPGRQLKGRLKVGEVLVGGIHLRIHPPATGEGFTSRPASTSSTSNTSTCSWIPRPWWTRFSARATTVCP